MAAKRRARDAARDAVRDVILEAAERVFARGFRTARMADVAAEAGMATGTLYNYFESKDDVYQSLMNLRGSQLLAQLRAIAARREPAIDRLRALIETSFRYLEEHRALYAVFVEVGERAQGSELSTDLRAGYHGLFEKVIGSAIRGGALRSDVGAARLAAVLTGAMNGVMRAWIARDGAEPLDGEAAMVFTLLMEGAGKQ